MYPGQDPYQQPDPYQPYTPPPAGEPYPTGPAGYPSEYSVSPPAPNYPQSPPAYPPAGYSVPPLAQPVQAGGTNILGILALVFGIVSIPLDLCCYIGLPFAIAAIVLGIVGVVRANSTGVFDVNQGRSAPGKGMAIAGIACGAGGIVVLIILAFVGLGLQSLGTH
jgi:hypothetical protein